MSIPAPRVGGRTHVGSGGGAEAEMDALARLIQRAMTRRGVSAEVVAARTGIRTPRIKAFAEDGAAGPVRPTEEELDALALMLSLPAGELLAAGGRDVRRAGATS
ncbi:XRE family transcriptional regulator [Streptomyces sp. NPDC053367]|uniref:XRE family transcriptional regulator n=1 Tax=Streptomyces sp. NPDC053367 TaxID=3365700 RepID=UPI0037D06414